MFKHGKAWVQDCVSMSSHCLHAHKHIIDIRMLTYLCIEQHAVLRLLLTKIADISSYQPLEECASILTSDPHQGTVL